MSEGSEPMRVLYERCAGVDVHKRTVVVTVVLTGMDGRTQKQTRTFGTMTADLLALGEWLEEERVTHVALESTGVYTLPTMLPKLCTGGSMRSRSCVPTFAPPMERRL